MSQKNELSISTVLFSFVAMKLAEKQNANTMSNRLTKRCCSHYSCSVDKMHIVRPSRCLTEPNVTALGVIQCLN